MLSVSLVTPTGTVFQGKAEEVILSTLQGAIGVRSGHEKLVAQLQKGRMTVKEKGRSHVFETSAGFADISGEEVTVLCGTIRQKPTE